MNFLAVKIIEKLNEFNKCPAEETAFKREDAHHITRKKTKISVLSQEDFSPEFINREGKLPKEN